MSRSPRRPAAGAPPGRLGRYRIVRQLGEGGMGVVYAAHDDRLGRTVALKVIRRGDADERARKRFWREARFAAAVDHPGLCQIHEIEEEDGTLFITMPLLEGEPLAARLERGALPAPEATRIALALLDALEHLHGRGLVHRDLKPSNIFLTSHGVKVLDFGLAQLLPRAVPGELDRTPSQLTQAGAVVGTPRYMSPEQLQGRGVDARSDLFAVGAILFEMLTGKHAFPGETVAEVFHATVYEEPPALGGSPMAAALDAVIRRSLAKGAQQRPSSAAAMARELREASIGAEVGSAPRVVAMTRLIVLPFRVLRPDAEIDFLAFSLPDAITASLSGLQSVVVRSSLVAARFADETPNLRTIAAEADVDAVLTGTLLRAGEALRVSAQLVEAPSGAVVWSQTSQVTLRNIFELQDGLVGRIVDALSLPLTEREHRLLRHDVPANPTAYEFYLRANQLTQEKWLGSSESFAVARDLYLRCLEDDPGYAPAWARLARCYRLLGRAGEDPRDNQARAESSLKRALDLNPNLALAHRLYAQIETDEGHAVDAVSRILRHTPLECTDAEVFAGLVHACRYCGLLEASVAAHERARHLDPTVRTGVWHTYWLRGEHERALEALGGLHLYIDALILASMGREAEAISALRDREAEGQPEMMHAFVVSLRALLEGNREESVAATEKCLALFRDPEPQYYMARQLARLGLRARALDEMGRVVERGFHCPQAFSSDPWLQELRDAPEFKRVLERAEDGRLAAATIFVELGGERLLGFRMT
jgi:serine/threonine protein kinase/tetratricopeptide (TPR) repeat protein